MARRYNVPLVTATHAGLAVGMRRCDQAMSKRDFNCLINAQSDISTSLRNVFSVRAEYMSNVNYLDCSFYELRTSMLCRDR